MVIMEGSGSRIERTIPLIMALGRLQFDTDVLVTTPEEFERKKDDESTFIHQIVNISRMETLHQLSISCMV